MIRAMVWKEYREHRTVWLTLAVVGGAGLYGLTRLMAPDGFARDPNTRQSLQAVAALLAWTYGLVCGAMLLAGERESATLTFLDMLPVRRIELWLAKCLIGLALFLGQLAVLSGFVVALGLTDSSAELAGTLTAMTLFGLFGMSWGLLFSARGESVLNVIGLAIAGQVLSLFAGALLAVLVGSVLQALRLFGGGNGTMYDVAAGGVALIALTVAPVVGSARIFSRPDRLRGGSMRAGARRDAIAGAGTSWGRAFWLGYSQMRRLMLGLLPFALGLGLLVPAAGPIAWPVLTLFLGVLCGVTVCSDEQMHGSFRFLGDQRFPLGRIWVVKVVLRLALAVAACFALLLPSLVLAVIHRSEPQGLSEPPVWFARDLLHSCLVGPVVPIGIHLSVWLLYGFSAGQLGGLLFRKSLVAAVVSLGAAVTLVCVWLPSLLGVGLHFWQVAGVPVILLATAWLLMPAWAADRLLGRGTFMRLGAGLTAVVLWTAGGLWYRVQEVPDLPDSFEMAKFVAGIPTPEENRAGLAIRGAWGSAESAVRAMGQTHASRPLFPGDPLGNRHPSFATQVEQVLERGWPAGDSELGDWMDREAFRDDWPRQLAEAADERPGFIEDARLLTIGIKLERWRLAPHISRLLAARGLQLQARGDEETFVKHLRAGLALSRTFRHAAPAEIALSGWEAEKVWMPALDRWMERLKGRPDLLREVLTVLIRHEVESPDPAEMERAGYLITLTSLEEVPDQMVEQVVPTHPYEEAKLQRAEIEAATLLWRVPWEQARHQRIVRAVFQGDLEEQSRAFRCGGPVLGIVPLSLRRLGRTDERFDTGNLRAAQLRVALRLYQAEEGQPAASLDALVPRYLPVLPIDPYSGIAFHYRLSAGETIGWPHPEPRVAGRLRGEPPRRPRAGMDPDEIAKGAPPVPIARPGMARPPQPQTRFVPDGQGILWSVGADGYDDGGKQQSLNEFGATISGEDIIYLIPLPPA